MLEKLEKYQIQNSQIIFEGEGLELMGSELRVT